MIPRRRRVTEHEIWEDVLKAFANNKDIEFAYPTQRFYNRADEKRGLTSVSAPTYLISKTITDRGGIPAIIFPSLSFEIFKF